MKKMRFLLALAVVITLISTVAMAATCSVSGVEGTDIVYTSGDLTINVVADDAYEAFSPQAWIAFDSTKWTVATPATGVTGGTAVINAQTGYPTMAYLDLTTIAKNTSVISAVFTPVAGADVYGSTFAVTTSWIDGVSFSEDMTFETVYTVVEPAAQDTPATVSAPNMAWAEYTVGNTLYKGIWTGAYTVTAGTKKVDDITVAVNGAAAESLDVEAEPGATVDFKIAVIGKPELNATGIVVTAVEAQ